MSNLEIYTYQQAKFNFYSAFYSEFLEHTLANDTEVYRLDDFKIILYFSVKSALFAWYRHGWETNEHSN